MSTPAPMSGSEKASTLTLSPIRATSHPAVVDPTFAPKMTQRELTKVRMPALTKPIVRSVVVVDDCKRAVATRPKKNPFVFVLVHFSRIFVSAGPDADLSHSVMMTIPRRKSPTPQKSIQKGKDSVMIVYHYEI